MNSRGLSLFAFRGITVRVDYSWFIIFALIVVTLGSYYFPENYPALSDAARWTISIMSALLLFVSVLLHEFSHSLVAQKFGIEINGIVLFLFGGIAQLRSEPEDPRSELYIAAAGPLCSLILGIFFLGLHHLLEPVSSEALQAMLWYLGYLNIALVAFNILPGFPLDGGRIARAVIWYYTDNLRRATKIVSNIGRGLAFLIIGTGLLNMLAGYFIQGLFLIFLGMFLQQASIRGYQFVSLREGLSNYKVADLMTPDPHTVPPDITLQELVDHYFYRFKVHSFPVTSGDELIGFITIKNVKSIPRDEWNRIPVKQVMHPIDKMISLSPKEDAFGVLQMMLEHNTGRMPVLENGKIVGILTRRDIMEFVSMREEISRT